MRYGSRYSLSTCSNYFPGEPPPLLPPKIEQSPSKINPEKLFLIKISISQCGVSAPQLLVAAAVGSMQKTHPWDLDKKLIKRLYDSYGQFAYKTSSKLRL